MKNYFYFAILEVDRKQCVITYIIIRDQLHLWNCIHQRLVLIDFILVCGLTRQPAKKKYGWIMYGYSNNL